MARNIREPIPLPVILAASEGDERALNAVLNHYKGYIRFLAMRPMKDEYGNEHLYVDEDMRLRLEAKLLYSIVTGFKVLPVKGTYYRRVLSSLSSPGI